MFCPFLLLIVYKQQDRPLVGCGLKLELNGDCCTLSGSAFQSDFCIMVSYCYPKYNSGAIPNHPKIQYNEKSWNNTLFRVLFQHKKEIPDMKNVSSLVPFLGWAMVQVPHLQIA